MGEETELLREIRDLLLLLTEPGIAKRDESRKSALFELVGRSKAKTKAVAAMDGSRSRSSDLQGVRNGSRRSEPPYKDFYANEI